MALTIYREPPPLPPEQTYEFVFIYTQNWTRHLWCYDSEDSQEYRKQPIIEGEHQ